MYGDLRTLAMSQIWECMYTAIFHYGDLSLLSTYFLIQPILPRSMMYKSNNAIIKCSTTIK